MMPVQYFTALVRNQYGQYTFKLYVEMSFWQYDFSYTKRHWVSKLYILST